MDSTIENIISDLNTVGKISIGDKIGVFNDHVDIQREGFLQSIMRIYNGDSRSKAISYISNIINLAITIMSLMMESEHFKQKDDESVNSKNIYQYRYYMLRRLLSSFVKSAGGLRNLTLTYHADDLVCKQLHDVIEKQSTFVDKCASFLQVKVEEL